MSIDSGAVGIRRRFVSGARAAVLAAVLVATLAVVVTVALWNATADTQSRGGSDAFVVAPQLHPKGGLVEGVAETGRGEIVVGGEVCEVCWKYR
jgi:hypothetical protein